MGAGKPPEWPGPEGEATTARLLWDDDALYICYECEGDTAAAIDAASVAPEVLSGMEGGAVPEAARSVLLDERVEAFVWPKGAQDHAGTPEADQHYFAFECNFAGVALTNKAQFGARMDFSWGSDAYSAAVSELAVGWGATSSPVPSAVGGLSPPFKTVLILTLPWAPLGVDPSDPAGREGLRLGLHRALWPEGGVGRAHQAAEGAQTLEQSAADALLGEMIWTSWIAPTEAPAECAPFRPRPLSACAPPFRAPLPRPPSAPLSAPANLGTMDCQSELPSAWVLWHADAGVRGGVGDRQPARLLLLRRAALRPQPAADPALPQAPHRAVPPRLGAGARQVRLGLRQRHALLQGQEPHGTELLLGSRWLLWP